MAADSGWTKAAADRALRAMLASIRTSLKRGQPVTLVGFGTFSVGRRKPRKGKNPRTGLPMHLSAESVLLLAPNGTVLFAKNPSEDHAPASLVKLMTLYLACEDLEA